jgi:prophage regulatory protein
MNRDQATWKSQRSSSYPRTEPKSLSQSASSEGTCEHKTSPRDTGLETGVEASRGGFDERAIREMLQTAQTDPKGIRRTIRRTELRLIVPLADSTIYEMERRDEFPKRFFLTPRCVVWDLAEVLNWLDSRRKASIKKAPHPDFKLRRGSRKNN